MSQMTQVHECKGLIYEDYKTRVQLLYNQTRQYSQMKIGRKTQKQVQYKSEPIYIMHQASADNMLEAKECNNEDYFKILTKTNATR